MKTKDKGGRPAHDLTTAAARWSRSLSGFAIPQDKIADVIGVDGKTLRKHYATELQRGAATVEAKLVGNLLKLASGSDGTALKAIMFALQCTTWPNYWMLLSSASLECLSPIYSIRGARRVTCTRASL